MNEPPWSAGGVRDPRDDGGGEIVICAHENRPADLTGVKLLTLSLADHCPDLQVDFSWTHTNTEFSRWLTGFPQVRVRETPELDGRGWNVKPALLLYLLDEGHREVVWLDSDVILDGDLRPLMSGLPPQTLVATEEPAWGAVEGSAPRTLGWGLEPGRDLKRTANSCLLRVTREHRTLLQTWQQLLDSSEYREAQARPWHERPMHLIGDQDVLTALLGSRDFAHLPVRLLKRGTDIVQSFDASTYTMGERLGNGFSRLPPLVHAQRQKPWQLQTKPSLARNPQQYYHFVFLELAPYTHVARRYRDLLGEPTEWMTVRTLPARVLRFITRGNVNLQSLPHLAATRAARPLRRLFQRGPDW